MEEKQKRQSPDDDTRRAKSLPVYSKKFEFNSYMAGISDND